MAGYSDEAYRALQDAVPLLGVRYRLRSPKLYRFDDALREAKQRVGVWRLHAYYTTGVQITGDNARRPPRSLFPWQKGYHYAVVGRQVFEGSDIHELYRCLCQLQPAIRRNELWWFAIAPQWDLVTWQKTQILDALPEK
jgi:hypothetical protein